MPSKVFDVNQRKENVRTEKLFEAKAIFKHTG